MQVAELFAALGLHVDQKSWDKGDKAIAGVHRSIEGLHHALEAYLGFEAVKKIGEMVSGVVELGSALNDTAQKTGLSVEGLQFYGFVAKQNSSSMEDLAGAIQKYSKGLDEANTKGSGPVADAFQRLGINFRSAAFKANSLDEQVQLVADALAKLPDGTKKTALAMDLFGRSGATLIPTLNDLGHNGDELRAKFEELGGGLSTDQAADLDTFGDEIDQAKFSIGALKNQIVAQMLPTLRAMLHGFVDWVKANREVIKSTIEGVVRAGVLIAKAAATIGAAIGEAIGWLTRHKEVATAVLAAIGGIITAFAVQAAIDWAIAFFPLIAATALVVGLIEAIEHLNDLTASIDVNEEQQFLKAKQAGLSDEDAAAAVKSSRAKGASSATDQGVTEPQSAYVAQNSVSTSGSAPSLAVTNGDTNITVTSTTGDPKAIAEEVQRGLRDQRDNDLRHASAILRGGR